MLVSLSLTSTTSSVASFEESMLTKEQIAKRYNLQAAAVGQPHPPRELLLALASVV